MFSFSFIFLTSKHFSLSSRLLSLFLSLALIENNEAQQTQHRDHRQENHFFNGSSSELSSRRATLRLQFFDTNLLCVVSRPKSSLFMASAASRRTRNHWTRLSEETAWSRQRRFFRNQRSLGF